jgi:hypothetical protein
MSGVVKIEITESAETLKQLLQNASTPQEKERIQTIYWLKTCFDIDVAYRTVHQLVRYKLKSKLKVPRPLHIKQRSKGKL